MNKNKILVLAVIVLFMSMEYSQVGAATVRHETPVTATTEFIGGGTRLSFMKRLTVQQAAEVETLIADLHHHLQGIRPREDARQAFSSFLSRLSSYHLVSPTLRMERFIEKASQEDDNGLPSNWDPFSNRWCFLVCYVAGYSFDVNFFTIVGIGKLFLGDPSGSFWWDYGHLKPFRLGQPYTQVAVNYSENQCGFIASLGLLGLKVGNISNAEPMVTIEQFTGMKITFKIRLDDSLHILVSEKCLYIGFASAVYEGDVPD